MEVLLTLISATIGAVAVLVAQFISRRLDLQLTAAKRRIQAQQETFTLWWRLGTSRRDEVKRNSAIAECERFWSENCLYLGRKTRREFRNTLADYWSFDFEGSTPLARKEFNAKFEAVFHTIMADAKLPELTESVTDVRRLMAKEK